jgi:hypothetical protein
VRLLIDPDLLKSDSFATAGGDQEGIPQLLRAASAAIGEKWKVMTDPVWALADMVLIKALLHSPDLEEWETKLKDHASERFPFDSLLGLISTLAKSDIPAAHALKELAKRLEGHVAEKWPPKKAVNPS